MIKNASERTLADALMMRLGTARALCALPRQGASAAITKKSSDVVFLPEIDNDITYSSDWE
ncbi:hypothetical protein AC801_14340 [Xanthomonas sp. ISO98C4]|nr:hypothetical protein AC801_14340 [Xanthomonas sp. ISO98C4]